MLSFSDQEKKQMRIVGISGGDLQSTDSLNRYALQLTEIDCPNVLFVPTASDDEEGYIEKIEKTAQIRGFYIYSPKVVCPEGLEPPSVA